MFLRNRISLRFSFGRLLTSKTKKRSPEVICLIASGLLFLGAMA